VIDPGLHLGGDRIAAERVGVCLRSGRRFWTVRAPMSRSWSPSPRVGHGPFSDPKAPHLAGTGFLTHTVWPSPGDTDSHGPGTGGPTRF